MILPRNLVFASVQSFRPCRISRRCQARGYRAPISGTGRKAVNARAELRGREINFEPGKGFKPLPDKVLVGLLANPNLLSFSAAIFSGRFDIFQMIGERLNNQIT